MRGRAHVREGKHTALSAKNGTMEKQRLVFIKTTAYFYLKYTFFFKNYSIFFFRVMNRLIISNDGNTQSGTVSSSKIYHSCPMNMQKTSIYLRISCRSKPEFNKQAWRGSLEIFITVSKNHTPCVKLLDSHLKLSQR